MKISLFLRTGKNIFPIIFLFLLTISIIGCNRSEDKTDADNYVVTISLIGVNASEDYIWTAVSAGITSGSNTVWKKNGQIIDSNLTSQVVEDDFGGSTNTYIFETARPVSAITVNTLIQNLGSGVPITGFLAVEKNGVEQVYESINVSAGGNFQKDYSF